MDVDDQVGGLADGAELAAGQVYDGVVQGVDVDAHGGAWQEAPLRYAHLGVSSRSKLVAWPKSSLLQSHRARSGLGAILEIHLRNLYRNMKQQGKGSRPSRPGPGPR